ncbi:MAG: glycerate kinase [Pseudomonadota bacterium]
MSPAPPSSALKSCEVQNFLRSLFDEAVASVDPLKIVAPHLPKPPRGKTLIVAAGKAAASMAKATEEAWPAHAPFSGTALTRYEHGLPCEIIEVIEAAHPVPDDRGHVAAQKLLQEVSQLGEDDLLLFLVSGGGSSLLALPADGISLDEKKAVNKVLLRSGAPIGEMNAVRKHISAVKGGRLAQAAMPAQVVTVAISDVPFDDPSTIASGPTVPDPTTREQAKEIIARYGIDLPASVMAHLNQPTSETPKPDDPLFERTEFKMIATPAHMIEAVEASVEAKDLTITSLGADLEGEARDVGREHALMALAAESGLIISGGETTVTVAPNAPCGRGGRNCEYLLALAIALNGASHIHAIAADTDGIDGSEDNAGAIITPDTLARARAMGLDPQAMLDGHDAYTFFEKLGDLVTTGPTRTNVNDFRAIHVGAS